MPDLPANVTFPANADGFSLDQDSDRIRSIQASNNGSQLIIELWGTTDLIAPDGKKLGTFDFQQNADMELAPNGVSRYEVRRIVYSDGQDPDTATHFVVQGDRMTVPDHRRT